MATASTNACDTSLRSSGGTHFSLYVGRETAARIASLAKFHDLLEDFDGLKSQIKRKMI